MHKTLSILLILTSILIILPGETLKQCTKKSSSTFPIEKQETPQEEDNTTECEIKYITTHNLSVATFQQHTLIAKAKFYHEHQPIPNVHWLESFSTPPDLR